MTWTCTKKISYPISEGISIMSISIRRSLLIAFLIALTLAILVLGGAAHVAHVAAMSFNSTPGMSFN